MPQEVQRPIGPENRVCPLHRETMDKVCHRCPLWIHVRGKPPQSEAEVDYWDCSLAWMPMLLIENSQMQRQTGAAVESFRNEMVKANQVTSQLLLAPFDPKTAVFNGGKP